jgi:predicted cobalt transporter CbtA
MTIFRNVVFVAALAGLVAGLAMSAMQFFATTPLIVEAEEYEEWNSLRHPSRPARPNPMITATTIMGTPTRPTMATPMMTTTGMHMRAGCLRTASARSLTVWPMW